MIQDDTPSGEIDILERQDAEFGDSRSCLEEKEDSIVLPAEATVIADEIKVRLLLLYGEGGSGLDFIDGHPPDGFLLQDACDETVVYQ